MSFEAKSLSFVEKIVWVLKFVEFRSSGVFEKMSKKAWGTTTFSNKNYLMRIGRDC